MPGIMCPAFIFLPDKNTTTSIETLAISYNEKLPSEYVRFPKQVFRTGFQGAKNMSEIF